MRSLLFVAAALSFQSGSLVADGGFSYSRGIREVEHNLAGKQHVDWKQGQKVRGIMRCALTSSTLPGTRAEEISVTYQIEAVRLYQSNASWRETKQVSSRCWKEFQALRRDEGMQDYLPGFEHEDALQAAYEAHNGAATGVSAAKYIDVARNWKKPTLYCGDLGLRVAGGFIFGLSLSTGASVCSDKYGRVYRLVGLGSGVGLQIGGSAGIRGAEYVIRPQDYMGKPDVFEGFRHAYVADPHDDIHEGHLGLGGGYHHSGDEHEEFSAGAGLGLESRVLEGSFRFGHRLYSFDLGMMLSELGAPRHGVEVPSEQQKQF